jgi:hypothetical protein
MRKAAHRKRLHAGDEEMKNYPGVEVTLSLALCIFSLAFVPQMAAQSPAAEAARKTVIVELFTSEGCSTCPPADALLQKLQERQLVAGAEVIALEEHVDYWNHLGWSDPYSSPEWTQRQLAYSTFFKTEAFTPQMVVDGDMQFVGNNEGDVSREIENAARRVEADVAIGSGTAVAKGERQFTVSVGALGENAKRDVAEVWLAVTEDGLQSSVSRGENSGHVLHHAATLRSLHKIGVADPKTPAASFTGDPRVKFDSHWNQDNLRVVVFVQEKKSREILGAASLKVLH